jgi:hypothetical protein
VQLHHAVKGLRGLRPALRAPLTAAQSPRTIKF